MKDEDKNNETGSIKYNRPVSHLRAGDMSLYEGKVETQG
jgi:hypothetical protein